jgi:hypothetical protein
MSESTLWKIEAIEGASRALRSDQLHRLADAVESLGSRVSWNPRDRYWFSGTPGLELSAVDDRALRFLWTRIQAALVRGATGENLDEWPTRPGVLGRLDRIVEPNNSHRMERRAAYLLQRHYGAHIWTANVAIWNATCAVVLHDRLSPDARGRPSALGGGDWISAVAFWVDCIGSEHGMTAQLSPRSEEIRTE